MQPNGASWIVEKAREIGFDLCGIAPIADFAELGHLPEWLNRGYAGEMNYLHDPRRLDPVRVLEGARSLIVVALNYNAPHAYSTQADAQTAHQNGATYGWISRYAWGDDYHSVIGEKLETLAAAVREHFPEASNGRTYVDTGPIIERIAAKYAGLGWLAKNTCLINQKLGSWLFLGVIITSLELAPTLRHDDSPAHDLCGTCRRCIDACPTQAIVEPYVLDARRCIAYLTIELRGPIPEEFRPAMGNMVFGCDICQDVCPWNRKSPRTELINFKPREFSPATGQPPQAATETRNVQTRSDGGRSGSQSLFAPDLEWLASLTEEEFRKLFKGSPVKRAKWHGLIRNVCVALGNSHARQNSEAQPRIARRLESLAASSDPLIAEHARWALRQLQAATESHTPSV